MAFSDEEEKSVGIKILSNFIMMNPCIYVSNIVLSFTGFVNVKSSNPRFLHLIFAQKMIIIP